MSAMLHDFHFLRPWFLLGLVLLPLIGWLGMRRQAGRVQLERLVDADLLPQLLFGQARRRSLPVALFMLGWTLCTLALAGPTWNRVTQPLYARRAAQVVAISLSRHMLSRDVAPSRMARARYKAHALLQSNRDGLNALVGYAGEAFVVAPLTSDAHSLDDLLDAMDPDTMPVDGDNAAAAIRVAVKLLHDGSAASGSLVLITDQADSAADEAAAKARAAGVRVSVLGVGTRNGGPIPLADGGFLNDGNGHMVLAPRNDAALAALAVAGGGRYVPMTASDADVQVLHGELLAGKSVQAKGELGDQWQDRGPWLLLPLLLLVALGFRRGWLLLVPLVLLPLLPTPAHAGTWSNLWQRPDQQAEQALRQGNAKQALVLARDPALRGAAAYRAGDYAAAAQALTRVPGSDAAYNRGNALAKAKHYEQAIKAYDEALKLDPGNVDAKANRTAVEDWLKQQEKKKQEQQNKKSGSGKQDQSKQDQGKNGQGKNDQDKNGQGKNDGKSSSSPQDKDGKPSPQSNPGAASDKPQDGGNKTGNGAADQSGNQPKPQTPEQQAQAQARQQAANKAVQQQMDQALAAKSKAATNKPSGHELGMISSNDPESKLPADVRQALQRVPDDPGALLRRKFELEYQERHGGAPNEDNQP